MVAKRLLPLFLACLLTTAGPAAAAQKGASVTLRARWAGTPYLLEAAEFLADEGADRYWDFVGGLGVLPRGAGGAAAAAPPACWRDTLARAAPLAHPAVARLLPVSLGARQYSARLELYRQLAGQLHPNASDASCCFASVGGRFVPGGDAAALAAALAAAAAAAATEPGAAQPQLHDFDHVYNPAQRGARGAVHAVLYGAPGTPCFAAAHAALRAAADAGAGGGAPLVYVHRPLLGAACKAEASACLLLGTEEQLVLPGYGVEAVLKNTEYSAMDDKKSDAAGAAESPGDAAGADGAPLGEVKGFRLDALAARRPERRQELLAFRDALLASEEDAAIKVWDVKDAGLQAATRISQSSDPLALLQDVSQGFPTVVSSLTRQKVDDKLRAAIATNQRVVAAGANLLLLNGMLVEVNNFELFAFLDRLRIELRMVGQLQDAGLEAHHALKVLEARASDATASVAFDIRLDLAPYSKLPWLNNPEKDPRSKGMYGGLEALMQMYPGRLRQMPTNAFHLVYLGDPSSDQGLAVGRVMHIMHERGFPTRLATLPLVPDAIARAAASRAGVGVAVARDPPAWKDMSFAEQFARAFLTLRSTFGGPSALKLWDRLGAAVGQDKAARDAATLRRAFVAVWAEDAPAAATRRAKVAAKKPAEEAWADLAAGAGYSSEAGMALDELAAFMLRRGLGALSRPVLWVNGVMTAMREGEADWREVDREVGMAVAGEHQYLQEQVFYGRVSDDEPLMDQLLELATAVRRWNPAVLGAGDDGGAGDGGDGDAKKLAMAPALAHPGAVALTYLYAPKPASGAAAGGPWGPDKVHPVTHWVVADLSTPRGRGLAAAAADRLLGVEDDEDVLDARAALVIAPAAAANAAGGAGDGGAGGTTVLDALVSATLRAYAATGAGGGAADGALLRLVRALLRSPEGVALAHRSLERAPPAGELARDLLPLAAAAGAVGDGATAASVEALLGGLGAPALAAAAADVPAMAALARGPLALPPGAAAVFTNGRVVTDWAPPAGGGDEGGAGGGGGVADALAGLTAEDFELMHMYALDIQPGADVAAKLKSVAKGYLSARQLSDAALVASSAMGAQVYPDSRFGSLQSKQVSGVLGQLRGAPLEAGGAPLGPGTLLHLVAVTNPLTREARRMSQVLRFVRDVLGDAVAVQLRLNPRLDLSEMPLKSFYRYALPEFTRDDDGQLGLPAAPAAYFPRLPTKRVLTLNLEVPEEWLVEPTKAVYDLDNLRLADVPEAVAHAQYELEAIMLTGSCTESSRNGRRMGPPRGLELQLGTPAEPRRVDTLVMSNMGYFQLKASPGVWSLGVAPGRSRDLYGILSVDGAQAAGGALQDNVTTHISSFSGRHLALKVRKRAGKENEPLLPAAGSTGGDAAAAGGGRGGGDEGAVGVRRDRVINVLTVASGHMYERLQKIMMLSVIKNTKSRVKFWIIKNYMSPHHRRVVPAMAAEYGFEYEFVTYKWPHWLHKQTDKQRIIWAYKILFLDVLFPLDVDRVIFVDSDQVVRTDLQQLMDMDLKGRAMAYTPFCDNNKEMDEFRFWKGGFWEKHLAGRPYHISALYVIDLGRFRRIAAGDNYRVMYENLSKDPNSLANLDQDLPNYAQHQIPIHSLPQEWLWCESWCGDATKAKAKTIDLCNNPKTKEPKLQAARRIIAEWPALDDEQAAFTATVDARYEREQAAEEAAEAAAEAARDAEAAAAAAAAVADDGGGGEQATGVDSPAMAAPGGAAAAGGGEAQERVGTDHTEL